MSVTTYSATGLTCGHCSSAVVEEISALPGVTEVSVDLVTDGASTVTVTADPQPAREQIAAALDEAGDYVLA